jgi:hypothetical protein
MQEATILDIIVFDPIRVIRTYTIEVFNIIPNVEDA